MLPYLVDMSQGPRGALHGGHLKTLKVVDFPSDKNFQLLTFNHPSPRTSLNIYNIFHSLFTAAMALQLTSLSLRAAESASSSPHCFTAKI